MENKPVTVLQKAFQNGTALNGICKGKNQVELLYVCVWY